MKRKLFTRGVIGLCAVAISVGAFAVPASAAKVTPPGTGKCDKKLDPIPVALVTSIDTPVLSLKDQADAAVASVAAFNKKYGGVGGHCIEITICDDRTDPNQAVACARDVASSDAVATVNDTVAVATADYAKILQDAGVPRVGTSPNTDDLRAANAYPIGAGGAGTTFMMVPPLTQSGHKKIYMIGVDVPAMDGLAAVMKPMIESYGAEFLGLSKVPAGTTDFQQFVLAAQRAGADGVLLPLDEQNAVQVLNAAKQLGTDLDFSVSLGTFGQEDIAKLGDFAKQMYFNAELPPITGDTKSWPILPTVVKDLEASGSKDLQKSAIKSSPFRSWVAIYHLKKIIEEFGDPDNVTRASLTEAMNKATNVDTYGLIPPWSPNQTVPPILGVFNRVSQPWYYVSTWDGKNFKVEKNRINLAEELKGNHEYAQPAAG